MNHGHLFTGRFNYSIPIIVPPARQGAEPKLGLGYNSSGGNSWCGVGWGLEVGFIQRDTRKGVPVKWTNGTALPLSEYDDGKGFVASLGGVSANLVKVSTSGSPVEYRAEVDGAFLKFLSYGDYWRVVDKSGNNFFFGQTNTTRMENPKSSWTNASIAKRTFRWALDRVVDVNGNETLLTYTNDANLLYLAQIRYNGNTNFTSFTAWNTVDFTLTNRTDTNITFSGGYRVEMRKLLSGITLGANGYLARRYALTYTNSASTPRSLLASVRMYGTDNTTSLPATTFMDGDGLPDRVMRKLNSPYDAFKVQLNKGPFPDLLNQVDNGIGGSVQITYLPSTKYDNTDSSGRARLPFPVYTVATVTVRDNMHAANTTSYSYLGGMFDGEKREFRRFNQVTVTDPFGTAHKT